jgi:hypothetical protein
VEVVHHLYQEVVHLIHLEVREVLVRLEVLAVVHQEAVQDQVQEDDNDLDFTIV